MKNLFLNKLNSSFKSHYEYQSLLKRMNNGEFPLDIVGPRHGYLAAMIHRLHEYSTSSLIICPTEQSAESLITDLELFTEEVLYLPWWGTMLYKGVSPQSSIFGRRSAALHALQSSHKTLVVTSLRAVLSLLPDPAKIKEQTLTFKLHDDIHPDKIQEQLVALGYYRTPRVTVHGEFALRGEVLDIYPVNSENAVRIVFDFDEIDEIKYFNAQSQTSSDALKEYTIIPWKEHLWDDRSLELLAAYLNEKGLDDSADELISEVAAKGAFPGEELYYPLVTEGNFTLADYINDNTFVHFVNENQLIHGEQNIISEYETLFKEAYRENRTVPKPGQITCQLEDITKRIKKRFHYHNLKTEDLNLKEPLNFPCDEGRSYLGNITYFKEELQSLLDSGYSCFIFSDSESQAGRISYLLKDLDVKVVIEPLSSGFILPKQKIAVIQENEIFGRKKRIAASIKKVKSQVISSFVELNPGDYIVHITHGIGLFKGIRRMKIAGNERDYIALEYAGDEAILVPIEQVNLVQRYIGQGNRKPALDKIGGTAWKKKHSKVKKAVEDMADRLIVLYARRQTARGFAFPEDTDFQVEFEADFPFEETDDQLKAVDDIKEDMQAPRPMDRLICGDVGYGKTEVAMRAAFKAVMGGKQVAYLCPTTILAEQIYENFVERFRRFPVKIGMMSRFVARKEQNLLIKRLENSELDILIGTHRILSKDIQFKNLGLMIIDEEQRFGVKDKERLKEVKSSIDCLTLSATPIPRTLHMSLAKIRDMSILLTAPYNRHPIETFIEPFNEELIARAVRREMDRGGQVFFLHNRVESLVPTKLFLQRLIPEAFVEVAHGQMDSRKLEEIMHRFIHGSFQVLVSTTIIENGIDIPNVNTIIIDRADIYGISQLYQLRGRVGRSDRLAYAYLLYPDERALSEIAMKRLQIISDFTELGSGFKVAMKDLEVRGAGNLLGKEQSGEILAVGFDMYLQLLEEAIQARMKDDSDEEQPPETYLELEYSGYIPDGYISDSTEKMEIYKKIAATVHEEELPLLHSEIFDRFGPLPDEVESLLSLSEMKILCRKLWISSLKERRGKVTVEFGKMAKISIDRILHLISTSQGAVKLDPKNPQQMFIDTGKIGLKEKSEFIKDRLSSLL